MTKLAKNFEERNGVVGLGIVAAMDENRNRDDATTVAVTPPIPIMSQRNNSFVKRKLSFEDMEMFEEYTCVMSYVSDNLVKKTGYFDGDFVGVSEVKRSATIFAASSYQISSVVVSQVADFLNSCFLCNKKLLGLDIFMYRGEKAFCSAECRYKQISMDEHKHKDKCGSGVIKPMDYYYSVSPCSAPMQCFSGVAAA